MWIIPSVLYWCSAGILGYTYVGYPLAIHALSRLRPRRARRSPFEPSVSFVMAAHNEERHIGVKLDNLLALEYPPDKVQVIVVSDGSSDRTDEIASSYRDQNVVLERVGSPSGKAVALNRGAERATGDVLVFCDVRQRIDEKALKTLMPMLGDPEVGAVSGELSIESERGPGLYWRYEKKIRLAESLVDSTVGATGALLACRRELFEELPSGTLLDDVYIPMQIVLGGRRVLLEPEARVFDLEASIEGEFSRKARTLAGNFQLVGQLPELLNPLKNRLFFQFVSHKLMRLVCPYALLGLFGANVMLVATAAPGWPFYAASLAAQVAAYGLALRGVLAGDKAGRLARICQTFVALNAAAMEGLRRYLKGDLGWTTFRSGGVENGDAGDSQSRTPDDPGTPS